MSLRRRETGRDELTDAMRHFLAQGCWQEPPSTQEEKLSLFLLSGQVLRNNLDGLRRVWADLGPLLKAQHRGECFAEMALRVGDWRRWPADVFGRMNCQAHPVVARAQGGR
jgi:hypothetical protein